MPATLPVAGSSGHGTALSVPTPDPSLLPMPRATGFSTTPTTKIGKPLGEVGRPGRGGYNLQVALKWEASQFKTVRVSHGAV